ncbi:MAG: filamentous hemagglutinin family protein [Methylotenera sp.]|nr:filamentous hemagglutinin family protein [Methylotenera sp.]
MNIGIYRLVYNTSRGIWMAVGEHVRGHQSGKNSAGKAFKKALKQSKKISLTILILGISLVGSVKVSFADPLLPANTIPTGLNIVNGAININAVGNSLLNITQASQKGILQGNNFNIGSASTVNFNHLGGAGSATLVRINGPKSIIEGALNSPNGSVYLINQNGILFANGARVNVNGLVASALDLQDSDFLSEQGHLLPAFLGTNRAAYNWGGDANGFQTVLVQVEPDAQIKAALGSSVLLFAPKVINQGSIETNGGQVGLAAGDKVYLSYAPELNELASGTFDYADDSALKGLAGVLVEVDSYQLKPDEIDTTKPNPPTELFGTVTNDASGRILAQRGNVTMASYLVNQNGRVTATSSATQKGSIRLLARDTRALESDELVYDANNNSTQFTTRLTVGNESIPNTLITGSRNGQLSFGENSVTTILAEDKAAVYKVNELFSSPQMSAAEENYYQKVLSAVNVIGTTITDDQIFNPPVIEAIGRQVTVNDNAKIVVPGGFINITAQSGQLFGQGIGSTNPANQSRLYLGKDTLVDAAGLKNVEVDLGRNFVEALLTQTDLNDDPINRGEFLNRQFVMFDIRNTPDSRVANLAGFVRQVPRAVGEKLADGGAVRLRSEGDFIQRAGSKVDVSGGSLRFNAGLSRESWLVAADGRSYALGDAPADTLFVNFLGNSNVRELQEAGYTEGRGSRLVNRRVLNAEEGQTQAVALQIEASTIALDGQLLGGGIYGERQRQSDNIMAQLSINLILPTTDTPAQNINIGNTVALASSFAADSVLPANRASAVEIDAGMLSRSGFEDIAITTGGSVQVNSAVNLVNGAKIAITGREIQVNKNIVSRSGDIALTTEFIEGVNGSPDTNITVADGVKLDVSGNWINDTNGALQTGRIQEHGGTVSISSTDEVTLGTGSLVDVSGGGYLHNVRNRAELDNGNAGSIHIATQVDQGTALNPFTYVAPKLNGELRGFALGTGGDLSITAPFITIGNSGFGDAREFLATPEFFQDSGFASFNLTGRDGVIVRSNTDVSVVAKNYQLDRNFQLQRTGARVNDFATPTLLPTFNRASTTLTLATQSALMASVSEPFLASGVSRGSIVVETNANIKVDSNGARETVTGGTVVPSISLSAWDNQIVVDGTLQALGGDISLVMNGSPSAIDDNGYNAAQAIWLGENAVLNASGHTVLMPNNVNQRIGTVYDGGHVNIEANKGFVVAKAGSEINVSGTATVLDVKNVSRITPTRIASNGGEVSVSAREGILLDSTFNASSPGGLAGSLDVRLTRGGTTSLGLITSPYPGTLPSDINVGNAPDQLWYVDVAQSGTFVPDTLNVGDAVQPAASGVAKISADRITEGGFSDVALKSEYGVRFSGDVNLTTSRSISLNARVIEATADSSVTLTAPNVVLANEFEAEAIRPNSEYTATTPVAGNAKFTVNANLADLRGSFTLSGFSNTAINSQGDIRLTGISNPNIVAGGFRQPPSGTLLTNGALELNARQIYPTTLTDYTITVNGAGSTVTINKINPTGGYDAVLSAGGTLNINAETINQNGVLLAPFGTIALNASETLNLNAGSFTSVSAQNALIPFGFTQQDGLDYLYNFGPANLVLNSAPERVVSLNAPNVNQNADSVIDISGGGDLFAYEWVPGLGGSSDVLAADANQQAFGQNATNTWVILPNNNQTFASFDPQYWQGSNIKAGDAVYISGAPGVAAGYYTLLPARYALLPGAVLVSAVSGAQDRTAGLTSTLVNGSTLVSGHLAAYTSNGYTQTARTAGFVVRSGADAYRLAQYNTTTASAFFSGNTQSQRTVDAGRLSIAATESLVLRGTLTAITQQTGSGAEVDIAAPNLLVVGAGEQTGQVDLNGINYLAIDETTLANFNAASLLLGGTRSQGNVDVVSGEVRLNGNANVTGPEVILAATDAVRLDNGATLTGRGTGAAARNITIGNVANSAGVLDGDGALIRVSGGAAATLTRTNVNADRGDLMIDTGATVVADGSVLLDGSRNTNLQGDIEFAEGAALAFSSGRISLGAPVNGESVTDGLWLQDEQLAEFTAAGSLNLNSQSTIDIYGSATFGNDDFDLTLQSAGLAGYQNNGQTATITAQNLTINNNNNAVFAPATALSNGSLPALGTGNLVIQAEKVSLGNNTVRLAGYDQIDINAGREIVSAGSTARPTAAATPNQLLADNNLTLSAPRLTTASRADYAINAGNLNAGTLKVQGSVGAQPTNLVSPESQGTRLSLSGDRIILAGGTTQASNITDRHAAAIVVKGGQVTVSATGAAATDNVTLENGASIDVTGSLFTINDRTVALPAGSVALQSANGDIDVQTGALVSVSAAGNGDAGRFSASAVNGDVRLAGTIKAVESGKKATASVDAKAISNISQVLAALGNFAAEQIFRVREGDITIGASDKITANNVKVNVDQGAITVNGTIDASGDKGGNIELFAKNDVTINRGAQLLAKGLADTNSTAGSLGNGGSVTLSSDAGIVSTVATDGGGLSGTLIDVSGDQVGAVKGVGGDVYFRAARTGIATAADVGNGVNVNSQAAAAVKGARRVSIGAVKDYSYATLGTDQQTIIRNDTNSFVANVNAQLAGFSPTRDGLAPIINPIIQVNSASDLTVSNNWTFDDTIPSGGELVLRANGNLIINGNLNYEQFTGYNTSTTPPLPPILAQRSQTWNYRLIAGADNNAVNPETVNQGLGDIVFGSARYARTGTGFINAVAGNNIDLGSTGSGASIYTVGLPDDTRPNEFNYLTVSQAREFYGDSGGDVNITAGGNIVGSETAAANQSVASWFSKSIINQSSLNPQARWFARYSAGNGANITNRFTNGVGTLGGGDVNVNAGGELNNLQVAAASNGRVTGNVNQAPDSQNLIELGGGDVNINTSGSANRVLLHTGKGEINVKSGGDLSTSLSLIDSQVRLQANNNLDIINVNNPTNLSAASTTVSAATQARFYSYTDESFINALSLAGNVAVQSADGESYPSTLSAFAPNGDIRISSVVLHPSATGGATLLAGNNINISDFVISEVDPASLPVATTPFLRNSTPSPVLSSFIGANAHTAGLLHANDTEPVRIYALNDIAFNNVQIDASGASTFTIAAPLISPKATIISAGNDVVDANVILQNIRPTDVSVIEAGNNIYYNDAGQSGGTLQISDGGIQVTGPGRLHVTANKDIDLGTSDGIRSLGNLYNPFLPAQGADLFVQAGAAAVADFEGILNTYVDPSSIYSSIYLPQLTQLIRTRTGDSSIDGAQALTAFRQLDKESQTGFINSVYFAELRAGGRDALDVNNSSFGDYSRSQRAILTMFPTFAQPETTQSLLASTGSIMNGFESIGNEEVSNPGDLSLFYSQIRSESGGAIEILVPGGLINAGLAVASDIAKPDSELGIVTLRGGDLLGFVRDDFLVNQSRVFTLGGSDLLLYSALGSIDAGRGAKTASSTPPPLITIQNGQVTFDFSGAVTGSGIAALTSTGGVPGRASLFAPYGEINAGEAGIRSAGDIDLGARVIIGADNIKVGGTSTGLPVASTGAAGLTAPASSDPTAQNKQGSEIAESAKTDGNKLAALPSLITVEVISLGDESTSVAPATTSTPKPNAVEDKAKKDNKP